MCELFALSSRFATDTSGSLAEMARRGGGSGPHKDGWGLAYYAEGDVRLVKDAEAASRSACLRFIREQAFPTTLALAHIRLATQGPRLMRNAQPFARELGGAMHVFAHNGHLDAARLGSSLPLGLHRPLGETDSERAFCALLARMQPLWLGAHGVPPLEDRIAVVQRFAARLRELGPANFLYADGDALFAHGHRRMQADREVRPPGLHVLERRCPGAQRAALFASVPLTAEPGWRALDEGELLVARAGAPVRIAQPPPRAL